MTPGTEQYQEIADLLRAAARVCQFAGARREILHLAARFETRADHIERRASWAGRGKVSAATPSSGEPRRLISLQRRQGLAGGRRLDVIEDAL
jgi:hypothetical protein